MTSREGGGGGGGRGGGGGGRLWRRCLLGFDGLLAGGWHRPGLIDVGRRGWLA
jgi:hypothetical protein